MSNQGLDARMTLMPAQARISELEAEIGRQANEIRGLIDRSNELAIRCGGLKDKANDLEAENARLRAALAFVANQPGLLDMPKYVANAVDAALAEAANK